MDGWLKRRRELDLDQALLKAGLKSIEEAEMRYAISRDIRDKKALDKTIGDYELERIRYMEKFLEPPEIEIDQNDSLMNPSLLGRVKIFFTGVFG